MERQNRIISFTESQLSPLLANNDKIVFSYVDNMLIHLES